VSRALAASLLNIALILAAPPGPVLMYMLTAQGAKAGYPALLRRINFICELQIFWRIHFSFFTPDGYSFVFEPELQEVERAAGFFRPRRAKT